jgi:hypothetical protein
MKVPIGEGFSCDPLPMSFEGKVVNPYTESLFEMWLQRPLSIREVVWQLEDISGIYAYESYCSSVSSDSGSTFTMVKN